MRALLCILALASLAGQVAAEEWYQERVNAIEDKCDTNPKDGKYNLAEFTCVMIGALDMKKEFDDAGTTIEAEYASAGGGDEVDEDEFIDYVAEDAPEAFQSTMLANLAGVNLDMPETEGLATVAPDVLDADFVIKLSLKLAASPEDFFPGDLKNMKAALMGALDPDAEWITDEVFVFQVLSGSSVMSATAFAPDEASADEAQTSASEKLGDKESATALLGVEVTEDPEIEVARSVPVLQVSTTLPIIIGVVAILLGLSTCFLAKRSGGKRRALWSIDYAGCCSTGCCSGYGLKGWSQGTFLAAIFLLGSAIPIYVQMTAVADRLLCIVEQVKALTEIGGDAAALVEGLGDATALLGTLEQSLPLLGIAAILPAALAAVFMILSAGFAFRTSSTMCCAKLFALITQLFCLLSAVLYIIFGALGVAVTLEVIQPILKLITGICETKIPIMADLAEGAKGALAMAEDVGSSAADLADIQAVVDVLVPTVETFGAACDCLTELMFDLSYLVVPGAVAAIASFYGLYSVHGLCCAAKCCYSPTGAGNPGEGTTLSKTDQAVQDV